MHKSLFTMVLFATLTSAYAAEDSQPVLEQTETAPVVADSANQIAKQDKRLHVVLGGGLTFGGDTLGTFVYTNGSTDSIKAGELLLLHAGLDYRLSEEVSLQGTLGIHTDTTKKASNGEVTFSRFPLDLLAYYHVSDAFRIGGGTRIVFGSKLKGTGIAANVNDSFDNSIGVVIEAEYMAIPMLGIKLRHVTEKFRPAGSSFNIDSSHFGVLVNLYL